GAQRLGGAHRPVEPRAVGADHDQLVAAAQTLLMQPGGEAGDLVGDAGPVVALPDAVFLLAIGRTVRARPGARQQQLGERLPSLGRRPGGPVKHALPALLPVSRFFIFALLSPDRGRGWERGLHELSKAPLLTPPRGGGGERGCATVNWRGPSGPAGGAGARSAAAGRGAD